MASKLTKEKALEISKELWTYLAETGKYKREWPKWKEYGEMVHDCPLCQYASKDNFAPDCSGCAYYQRFGRCIPFHPHQTENEPFGRWVLAETPKTRKKYAKLFLKQLEQL